MIGKWIKDCREEKGMSQNELAELLHTTRQNISHYENGRRLNSALDFIKDLSNVLDFSILIEKGEIVKMNQPNETIQVIKVLKKRLAEQFQYTGEITIDELINQVYQLTGKEFNLEPTYRAFLPKGDESSLENDADSWSSILMKKDWGRFEFDFELDGAYYIQAISFEIINPEEFKDLIHPYLEGTLIEEDSFWYDTVELAVRSEWNKLSDLKIRNISID